MDGTKANQNLSAVEVSLTRNDMQAMAGLDRTRRYLSGDFWTTVGSPYTIANLWDES